MDRLELYYANPHANQRHGDFIRIRNVYLRSTQLQMHSRQRSCQDIQYSWQGSPTPKRTKEYLPSAIPSSIWAHPDNVPIVAQAPLDLEGDSLPAGDSAVRSFCRRPCRQCRDRQRQSCRSFCAAL